MRKTIKGTLFDIILKGENYLYNCVIKIQYILVGI